MPKEKKEKTIYIVAWFNGKEGDCWTCFDDEEQARDTYANKVDNKDNLMSIFGTVTDHTLGI